MLFWFESFSEFIIEAGEAMSKETDEVSNEEKEFYLAVRLCYELLARTSMIEKIQVPHEGRMLPETIRKYGITFNPLADLTFSIATRRLIDVSLRGVMLQLVYRQTTYEIIEARTGFFQPNMSNYLKGKREITSGKWEDIIKAALR